MSKQVNFPTFSPGSRDICRRAVEIYGPDKQLSKTAEEAAELSAAISRIKTVPAKGWSQAADEYADVLIMGQQLEVMRPGFMRKVSRQLRSKLTRLEVRLEAEAAQ